MILSRFFSPWLALPLSVSAAGDPALTFVPAYPAANEPVALLIESASGCVRSDYTLDSVDIAARNITIGVDSIDAGPVACPPEHVAPRTVPLGAFPRGTYKVSFVACQFVPPGVEQCGTVQTQVLLVGGGDVVVPASGTPAKMLLAMSLLLTGVAATVRRVRA